MLPSLAPHECTSPTVALERHPSVPPFPDLAFLTACLSRHDSFRLTAHQCPLLFLPMLRTCPSYTVVTRATHASVLAPCPHAASCQVPSTMHAATHARSSTRSVHLPMPRLVVATPLSRSAGPRPVATAARHGRAYCLPCFPVLTRVGVWSSYRCHTSGLGVEGRVRLGPPLPTPSSPPVGVPVAGIWVSRIRPVPPLLRALLLGKRRKVRRVCIEVQILFRVLGVGCVTHRNSVIVL